MKRLSAFDALKGSSRGRGGLLDALKEANERQRARLPVDQRERTEKVEREKPPNPAREKSGAGTLIVGIDCEDGIVIASDRRVTRGTASHESDKVITINLGTDANPINVLFAAEGLTGIRDDFFLLLDDEIKRRKGVDTLYEVKLIVEDIISGLTTRYAERVGNDPIGVLMGGLENLNNGKAALYYVHARGFGERVPFICTGHGEEPASTLAKFLCDFTNLTVQVAAPRAAFVISWVSRGELDSTVGGKPVVFAMRDNSSTVIRTDAAVIDSIWDRVDGIHKKLPSLFSLD